jgi:GT2 family glycosyltransferase
MDQPEERPAASVIILNWNGRRFLDTCLTGVLAQELPGGYEVVLVDNASTDGSPDYVRTSFPRVRVVEAKGNLGFAGGNNLGFREARGRHLVLLNNDTGVRPGWLQALVSRADQDLGAGAVTSKLVFMDRPGVIQNAGSVVLTDGSGGDRGTGEEDHGQYEHAEEVFAACAGAALYRREALDDVGRFDETFFLYYEDTDLSWRMRLRGWRILYEPGAVVEHVHSGSSGEWSPLFIFHVDRNRLFMILKNARAGFAFTAFARLGMLTLKMAARLALRRGRRRTERMEGGGRSAGTSRVRIQARVMLSLGAHLPEMLAKRRRIRGGRKVSDSEIERWFVPRDQWHVR